MGKRKYFGTDGVRGVVGGGVINAEFALRLGHAHVVEAQQPALEQLREPLYARISA